MAKLRKVGDPVLGVHVRELTSASPILPSEWFDGTYVCVVVAPKSLSPVLVRHRSETVVGGSPDASHVFGGGSLDEVETYATGSSCVRQHMMPGALNVRDRRKGLGASLYVGGCATARTTGRPCIYSFSLDAADRRRVRAGRIGRTASADAVWESMIEHGLAEDSSGVEEEECEYYAVDEEQAGASLGIDAPFVLTIDPPDVYACATYELAGSRMLWETAAKSGLLLHANRKLTDAGAARTEPGVFAELDYSLTDPQSVADWLWWGKTEATPRHEDDNDQRWFEKAFAAVPRGLRAGVRGALGARLPRDARRNPTHRREDMMKRWLREYGPNSKW